MYQETIRKQGGRNNKKKTYGACSGIPKVEWWEEQPGAGNEGMNCGEFKNNKRIN